MFFNYTVHTINVCTFEIFSNIFFSKNWCSLKKKLFNFAFRVSEVFDECLVSNSY